MSLIPSAGCRPHKGLLRQAATPNLTFHCPAPKYPGLPVVQVGSSEMMDPQRRERAVMGLMAVHCRLPEEPELQRKRLQQARRYCARGIEQRSILLAGSGQIR